jgi:hypothetical protein
MHHQNTANIPSLNKSHFWYPLLVDAQHTINPQINTLKKPVCKNENGLSILKYITINKIK